MLDGRLFQILAWILNALLKHLESSDPASLNYIVFDLFPAVAPVVPVTPV
jgi:hypothetical protein